MSSPGVQATFNVRRRRLIAALVLVAVLTLWVAARNHGGSRSGNSHATARERSAAAQSERRAVTLAGKACELRRLQFDVAMAHLRLIELATEIETRHGRLPVGVVAFESLESVRDLYEGTHETRAIDASVALATNGDNASGAAKWMALVRLDSGAPGEWVFDRVLRAATGEVYVGWTPERGIDASMMPIRELLPEASEFVAGAESECVVWCSLDDYRSEDAYDPEASFLLDDPAALRDLWLHAFEVVGRDATVSAFTGEIPELVVTDDSSQGAWPGQPTTLAYLPLTNTVEIQRHAVRDLSASSGLDMVSDSRVLLLSLMHEAVHAHDCGSSPALLDAALSSDANRKEAANIVSEGHAEFVSKRAAETLGLSDEWDRRERALRRVAHAIGTAGADALRDYDIGHELMARVNERGGADAVRALVAAPPASESALLGE